MKIFSRANVRIGTLAVLLGSGLAGLSTATAAPSEPAAYFQSAQQCLRDGIKYCTETYPVGEERTLCIADVRAACNGS